MATKTGVPVAPVGQQTQPVTTLSKEEMLRYSRHLIMPEVGMEGQLKLKQAKVLLHRHRRTGRAAGTLSGGSGRGAHRDWSISTWWISRTCSGRCFSARADVGRPKIEAAADASARI